MYGGDKIKVKYIPLIFTLIIIILCISTVNAQEVPAEDINNTESLIKSDLDSSIINDQQSSNLEEKINNAKSNDEILLNPGVYKVHNIQIDKNITIKGNGNPNDVIIDGEKKSSIFLIRNPNVHVTFKNLTFINGLTDNFGGAISIETGNVYVDNCIFINNTALENTNAGAISNYGTAEHKSYLFVNNSLFLNNHADHDGGAITTCYANSDIYNSVFINNSAVRDGGAIRVSLYGYGNVQDCIFMFNHADEWGGAYYSWSGESNVKRCIFMNNTAGTNGGAVMVSGNINIEDSIIVNNNGGETGGSFYIQQPMYNAKTIINVHNNIITNNTSPYGKEIFIKWQDAYNLYTRFDDNDWGDEDPNDSSINDPNNVTSRSKVSKTIKSNLYSRLNVDLLNRYMDLLGDFFTEDSFNSLKNQFKHAEANHDKTTDKTSKSKNNMNTPNINKLKVNSTSDNPNIKTETKSPVTTSNSNQFLVGNSTSQGDDNKAYELNETHGGSVIKQIKSNIINFIILIVIMLILLAIGYKRYQK